MSFRYKEETNSLLHCENLTKKIQVLLLSVKMLLMIKVSSEIIYRIMIFKQNNKINVQKIVLISELSIFIYY